MAKGSRCQVAILFVISSEWEKSFPTGVMSIGAKLHHYRRHIDTEIQSLIVDIWGCARLCFAISFC
jgi:hypothetical protein